VVIAPQELERGREPLAALPAENIVEQAQHCGSFFEILRGLLWVLGRQPSARVIGMPVDPVCQDERALQESLRRVAGGMARGDDLTLIGMKPIWPDPDLGYIVPGHRMADGTRRVYRVENRVGIELARDLVSSGGLWNSGCFVGRGSALLGMLCAARPKEVHQMQTALACLARPSWRSSALQRLYADLPTLDFAGVVLQSSEGRLRVLASVPLIDEKTAERI
jgi:mannose-1-phosphate guanylyltransferase